MKQFSKSGNTYWIHDPKSMDIYKKLPAGVYLLKLSIMGFYLEIMDNFDLPGKVYGGVPKESKRILATYLDRASRGSSTGVLLTGERGSGKTMLAKKISLDAQEQDIPTIVINEKYTGDQFNTFMQDIAQPCVILFDEYEKVYDEEAQQALLTLLDGTVKTTKLFILTSNDKWKINAHMQNRPGRIFYLKEYSGIEMSFIEEYCKDNLKPELHRHIAAVCQFTTMFYAFNFDMLKAVIEEMNRYDEAPAEALAMLNAKPGFSQTDVDYDCLVTTVGGTKINETSWSGNPLTTGDESWTYYAYTDKSGRMAQTANDLLDGREATKEMMEAMKIKRIGVTFTMEDMKLLEKNGTMHFENAAGFMMKLSKAKPKQWSPTSWLS